MNEKSFKDIAAEQPSVPTIHKEDIRSLKMAGWQLRGPQTAPLGDGGTFFLARNPQSCPDWIALRIGAAPSDRLVPENSRSWPSGQPADQSKAASAALVRLLQEEGILDEDQADDQKLRPADKLLNDAKNAVSVVMSLDQPAMSEARRKAVVAQQCQAAGIPISRGEARGLEMAIANSPTRKQVRAITKADQADEKRAAVIAEQMKNSPSFLGR
jgi:hypothetical protein